MKNSASGFALIELLLIPTLMGLLAGIYIVYRPNPSLIQYTRSLTLSLEALSIAAITFEDIYTVNIENAAYNVSRAGAPAVLEQHELPSGIYFENSPLSIKFNPSASCSPQTIALRSAGTRCTITTSLRCRIRYQCQ
jgi:hypothetical protein